jgi:hypothetical protein
MAEEAGANRSTAAQGGGETHAVAASDAACLPLGLWNAASTGNALTENIATYLTYNR